jgi:hypothetical protein
VLVLGGCLLVNEIFDKRERKKGFRGGRHTVPIAWRRAENHTFFSNHGRDVVIFIGGFHPTNAKSEMSLCLLL